MSAGTEQILNRLASLFGEIQAGSCPVDWVRMNPDDIKLILDHVSTDQLPAGTIVIWGAKLTGDSTLRRGTVELSKLGKRPLY